MRCCICRISCCVEGAQRRSVYDRATESPLGVVGKGVLSGLLCVRG